MKEKLVIFVSGLVLTVHLSVTSHWQSLISGVYAAVAIPTKVVQWLRLAISNGLNRVGVSHPSPEDTNRSIFQNVLLCVLQSTGWWTKSINTVITKIKVKPWNRNKELHKMVLWSVHLRARIVQKTSMGTVCFGGNLQISISVIERETILKCIHLGIHHSKYITAITVVDQFAMNTWIKRILH